LQRRKKTISNRDPPSKPQWPFTERRQSGDRRISDRRKGERRQPSAPTAREATPSFTGREREIVDLLMRGMSNRQIAHALGIAEGTVKKHMHHIFVKLGVRSRALLIVGQSAKKR
jgi:DNA-binding NarL/FixJ family response regulator